MTLQGEIVGESKTTCINCGEEMEAKVCRSAAGWYIGFFCGNCGPYSRESGYYRTMEEATKAMQTNYWRQ